MCKCLFLDDPAHERSFISFEYFLILFSLWFDGGWSWFIQRCLWMWFQDQALGGWVLRKSEAGAPDIIFQIPSPCVLNSGQMLTVNAVKARWMSWRFVPVTPLKVCVWCVWSDLGRGRRSGADAVAGGFSPEDPWDVGSVRWSPSLAAEPAERGEERLSRTTSEDFTVRILR